jgi:hypothetical protein
MAGDPALGFGGWTVKKWPIVWTFVLFLSPLAAQADFGLGVIIGSPTGISGKYTFSQKHAIDGAIAWDLDDDDDFYLHGDYLWLRNREIHLDNVALDWFFGIGGRLVMIDHHHRHRWDDDYDDDYLLGVRGPIGIGYTFRDPKIEVFGEVALIMNLVESTGIDLDGGIGARFHF